MREILCTEEKKERTSSINFQKIEKRTIGIMSFLLMISFLCMLIFAINYYNETYKEINLSVNVLAGSNNHFFERGRKYYVVTGGGIEHPLEFKADGESKIIGLEKLEGMQVFKILVENHGEKEEAGINLYVLDIITYGN